MKRRARFIDSFIYAAQGFVTALKQERNLRFHICVAFYVYLFSIFYKFTKTEYILLTLFICGVMALELVNSSLERAVENPTPDRYRTAGIVKDMAAAGVLVFSMGAAISGGLLFFDVSVIKTIFAFFINNVIALGCLVVSMVLATLFIIGKEDK